MKLLAVLLVLIGFYQLGADASAYSSILNFVATDAELVKLVNAMAKKDTEKVDFCGVALDYQKVYKGDDKDAAPKNLFARVNQKVLKEGTYAKLLALRKHYNPTTGVAETQSPAKDKLVEEFFDAVWKSGPFTELNNFLRNKKHPWALSTTMLRSAIKQLWFDNFSRAKGKLDSSGFEHVFFGEEKNGKVSGMHSWPVMYELEKDPAEKFDYRGYQNKHYDTIASVNLMWRGFEKPMGSFFANTSPAFDFSVLTACFLVHRGQGTKCNIVVDGCDVRVQSYEMIQNGKVFIGTTYPEVGQNSKQCSQAYAQRKQCCPK